MCQFVRRVPFWDSRGGRAEGRVFKNYPISDQLILMALTYVGDTVNTEQSDKRICHGKYSKGVK